MKRLQLFAHQCNNNNTDQKFHPDAAFKWLPSFFCFCSNSLTSTTITNRYSSFEKWIRLNERSNSHESQAIRPQMRNVNELNVNVKPKFY